MSGVGDDGSDEGGGGGWPDADGRGLEMRTVDADFVRCLSLKNGILVG
jgi:hypothetical protein